MPKCQYSKRTSVVMIENSAPNRWIENGEVCQILIGLQRVRLQEFHYLGLFCISVILEIRLCPDVCLYERNSQPELFNFAHPIYHRALRCYNVCKRTFNALCTNV